MGCGFEVGVYVGAGAAVAVTMAVAVGVFVTVNVGDSVGVKVAVGPSARDLLSNCRRWTELFLLSRPRHGPCEFMCQFAQPPGVPQTTFDQHSTR